jgi:hypothetical protein
MVKIGLSAIFTLVIGNIIGYYLYEKKYNFRIPKYIELFFYIFGTLFISLLTNDNLTPFIYFQF